jgi:hypothetical protein
MQIEDILAQLANTDADQTEKVAYTQTSAEFSPEILAIAQALSEDKEAIASLISSCEDSEKTAEAEKLAEELEFQGRLFARGLIAEQTKVAYLSDQIDEEQVQKTAEALNMSLEEIMGEKVADAHEEAYEAAKNNSGAGHVEVEQNAHSRPVAKAEELKGLASIAKALKKVKTLPTEQAINA